MTGFRLGIVILLLLAGIMLLRVADVDARRTGERGRTQTLAQRRLFHAAALACLLVALAWLLR